MGAVKQVPAMIVGLKHGVERMWMAGCWQRVVKVYEIE